MLSSRFLAATAPFVAGKIPNTVFRRSESWFYRRAHGKRTWIPDPAEQAVIRRVLQMYAADMTSRGIASKLIAEGVPSRSGRMWSRGTINSIVKRAMAGKLTHEAHS
jgi:hypothetical protein